MAGSLNRVQLIGYLGKDPEIKRTQNGSAVAHISIATSESWKDKNTGEKKEKTDWHYVVVWAEALVDICQKYLKKGSRALIEGKLQTRKWKDQSGNERYTTEVVLQGFDAKILLLDGRGNGRGDDPGPQGPDDYGSANNGGGGRSNGGGGGGGGGSGRTYNDMDDDIPFAAEFR
jgi:single-strand DNA-binding protein